MATPTIDERLQRIEQTLDLIAATTTLQWQEHRPGRDPGMSEHDALEAGLIQSRRLHGLLHPAPR